VKPHLPACPDETLPRSATKAARRRVDCPASLRIWQCFDHSHNSYGKTNPTIFEVLRFQIFHQKSKINIPQTSTCPRFLRLTLMGRTAGDWRMRNGLGFPSSGLCLLDKCPGWAHAGCNVYGLEDRCTGKIPLD
jgi:hypothetical protein